MQCDFFKNDGLRCEANAMIDSKYCFTHNPDTKEQLHEAATKGGKMPKRNKLDLPPVSIKNTGDIVILIEDTINLVRSGEIPVNVANSLGYLGTVALKALEMSDLEKRIEAIETTIGKYAK